MRRRLIRRDVAAADDDDVGRMRDLETDFIYIWVASWVAKATLSLSISVGMCPIPGELFLADLIVHRPID